MGIADLGKAGAELAETLRKLIAPFSDPVLSEAGVYIADKIRFLRFQNSLHVLERAKQLLSDSGIDPQAVDLKILVLILESASLESNNELIEKWATLLASAASGGQVLPAFT